MRHSWTAVILAAALAVGCAQEKTTTVAEQPMPESPIPGEAFGGATDSASPDTVVTETTAPAETPAATPPPAVPPADSILRLDRNQQQAAMPDPQSVPRIGLDALEYEMEQGNVVVVDVRNAQAYMAGHIPGAINLPEGEIDARADLLPKNKRIVTYCT